MSRGRSELPIAREQRDDRSSATPVDDPMAAGRWVLAGCVQGMGARPTVYRLAVECGLAGSVKNSPQGLVIDIEGPPHQITEFRARLPELLPQAANVIGDQYQALPPVGRGEFVIVEADDVGDENSPLSTYVAHDRAACEDCWAEVDDPRDRRFRYPFTSCTQCGPRYSIIRRMPYERVWTAMQSFPLCSKCADEDVSPANRRFHAQTNACPECGPQVWCVNAAGQTVAHCDDALRAAAESLRSGKIVAVKGVGGYQLLVDATDDMAVSRLRQRKQRPAKPLAVMVESIESARQLAEFDYDEKRALTDPSNPIVLLRSKTGSGVAPSVACGLKTVGLLLPTTPLHMLLLRAVGRPLVCTSGNRDGDPLAFDVASAQRNLEGVCDLWLHHDRAVERPIDDSVVRVIAGQRVTIRLARGLAPLPLDLPCAEPCLAVGGHLKAAAAWSNGAQAVLGPHIGELETLTARERFAEQLQRAEELYRFHSENIAHDLHPDYFTTDWARRSGRKCLPVQHHHAHVVAGMLEQRWLDREVLGVAWDGTGYGPDGTIWGGEFLQATATSFHRVATLRSFALPGGETAIREPWRTAVSVLSHVDEEAAIEASEMWGFDPQRCRQVLQMVDSGANSPRTTSIGRLFDAAAALILGATHASFEGEAATRLESAVDVRAAGSYDFPCTGSEPICCDWRPLLAEIVADRRGGIDPGVMAMKFHRALAGAVLAISTRFPQRPVVLSGGVFQNRVLTELIASAWPANGPPLGLPGTIPPNDGGLAAGQLAVWASRKYTQG